WRIARHVGGCGACRLERERLVALRRAMRQAEYHRAPGALRARIAAGLPLAAAPFAQAPVQDLPASDVPVSDVPVSDMPVSVAPEQGTPSQDMRAPNKPAVDRPPEAKPRFGADARGGARAGRWFARPGSRGPMLDRPGPGPGPLGAALLGQGRRVVLRVAPASAAGVAVHVHGRATRDARDGTVLPR
ncbi:anti-sigma factor, partial [Burkholderia thailandensis]|nr:anti-sigma factor [Burkholderia thailandensis]